jgi:CHAT domain-containing protein/predicted negative regulator of RcsB-dependent stress response
MKTIAFVCLCQFFGNICVFAQTDDENAVRKTINDYHNVIIKGDYDSINDFIRFQNPDNTKEIADIKTDFQRFSLKSFEIRSLSITGEKALVRCFYDRINPVNKQSAIGPNLNNEFLVLEKNVSGWKIINRYTAELDFANKLLAAKSLEERKDLIRKEKDIKIQTIIFTLAGQVAGRGNFEQSEEFLQLAEWFGEEFFKTDEVAKANNNVNIFNRKAVNHRLRGNYAEAIKTYDEASGIAEKYKLKGVGLTYVNKGILYFRLGNIELAEFYAKATESMFKDSDPAKQGSVFSSLNALFTDIYISKGDYKNALKMLDQRNEGFSVARGLVHFRQGNLDESLKNYENVIESFKRKAAKLDVQSSAEAVEAQIQITEIYLQKGDNEKALTYADKALDLALKVNSQEYTFRSLATKGKVLARLNRLDEAEKNLLSAIESIEDFRKKSTAFTDSQVGLLEENIMPYLELANLYHLRGENSKALSIAEKTKSRVLNDSLSGSKINRDNILNEPERNLELEYKIKINELNLAILRQNHQPDKNQTSTKQLDDELNFIRSRYASFQDSIFAKYPKLNLNISSSEIITPEKIDATLVGKNDTIVEYLTIGDKLLAFVLTNNGSEKPTFETYQIPASSEVFEMVDIYNEKIQNKNLDFQAESKSLFNRLIKPFQKQISGKTNLIIIPDSKLWNLSFASLMDEKNKFLVETFAISFAPSITVLNQIASRKSLITNESNGVLALGNPQMSENIAKNIKGQYRSNFGNLPEAEIEVQKIQKLYGKNSKFLIRNEATESVFKNEAGKYRILHLATHGIANSLNPVYSHLFLTADGKNDGLLEAWEILNLNLNADLVVLSACETNVGKNTFGEGILGLSWAFFIAGTKQLVASQWKVDSEATSNLMLNLHKILRSSKTFSSSLALQKSMLTQLKNRATKHPFYWAGFISIGKN